MKLESPALCEATAAEIEHHLVRRSGLDMATGELLYEITAGPLETSWESRISVRVLRERLVRVPSEMPDEKRYEMRRCSPFVWVEGSVHKAMLGHNVYGGPESFQGSVGWLLEDLGARVRIDLPRASEWLLRRADWAECYELPYEAAESYVWSLNQVQFPRRKTLRFGEETMQIGGRTTSISVYHKGPEFYQHDHKRLRHHLSPAELEALGARANETLRCEVQIKAAKLKYDHHGELPRVGDVTEDYLKPVHDREMARLVREGQGTMRTVRKQVDVRDRLFEIYNPRLAGLLFGTWLQLSALGEKETRRQMRVGRKTDRVFYDHRKQLQDAGVSWRGGDVLHVPGASGLPQDFKPLRSDPRRVAGEHPTVAAHLAAFRAA